MMNVASRRVLSVASRRVTTSRQFSALLEVTEEYPGIPSLSPQAAKASKASVSTLPSGLIVVTEDACTTSTVTMTYPKAGSGSEMLGEEGAALINKCLAFNSGSGLSTILINRTIENEGATPFASADRSGATLGYTVEPENAIGLVPLLALDCTFEKWDVRDAKALAGYQISEANKSAEIVLTEQIFSAAYGASSPMGRPFYCNDAGTYEIASFRSRGYGLNGAILAATGVKDHAAFCTEVDALTAEAPKGDGSPSPTATYLGGEARLSAPSMGYAHVALAFEAKVSSAMRNVIKQCLTLVGKNAGVSAFETSGLVGVYAGAPSEGVGAIDAALTETLTAELTPEIIAIAKAIAKADATFALDCGSKGLAAAMTAAVLENGSFTDAATVAKAYDTIAEKDVTAAVAAMLKSTPSLAAVGDIGVVPYQGTFASRF
ncbi:insulinase peptidase family M16 [Nitzschia inconspicua]|uniref:Insulinase peptidase family M16 n=1 Tax=Nitzschia inconspicua TaxID=303405 RepID=A0A9K3K424_9STRA|nr:insulinase peptidase family M16 [Nitzschia inconspicua]KAG7361026.1 insulinase peptidase family M16 [Nitzschia inconspicua]